MAPTTRNERGLARGNNPRHNSSEHTTSSNPSHNSSEHTSSYSEEELPYIFQLIEDQQWKELRKCLRSEKGYELCQERDSSKLNCLSMALGCNAPLFIVEEMVETDVTLATAKDNYGATAIHVACLNGAQVELINYLLCYYEDDIAKDLDYDGRSALHHAVENFLTAAAEDEEEQQHETASSMSLLQRLCEAAPEMVYVQDQGKTTPIDMVQVAKVQTIVESKLYKRLDTIYNLLKYTGIQVYMDNKKRWEEEGNLHRIREKDNARQARGQLTSSSESKADNSISTESHTSYSLSTMMTPHSDISRGNNSFIPADNKNGLLDENMMCIDETSEL
mmetsp:Transcript_1481/g.1958  ORF Transcript_1481/g.1958 Transcript_1481/m.1958 type:complete len:334 (-) Transcript_1481:2025-3026(-)